MHANDIAYRFGYVERAVRLAAQAASAEPGLPRELRLCIDQLDKQADSAREVLASGQEPRVRKLVREMAQQAEKAKRVCEYIPSLSAQIKGAVHHLHSQIQELKRDIGV